ncbi:hypothetical protein [Myxococcus phage Mx1]|nr:hypothetical protein [Myxococcus phage Mx1]
MWTTFICDCCGWVDTFKEGECYECFAEICEDCFEKTPEGITVCLDCLDDYHSENQDDTEDNDEEW